MDKNVKFAVKLQGEPYKCELFKRPKIQENCSLLQSCGEFGPFEVNDGKIIYHKTITPTDLVYLIKELTIRNRFYRKVFHFLCKLNGFVQFTVVESHKYSLIDHKWCYRASVLTWEKVEIDNLMSWLSTLGGAFSALGDSFDSAAERAGRISFYQLKLALKCGDPTIVARCKLYYSISLIQKGRLREAKQIILNQFEYAKQERDAGDSRLYKMCHGIWLKLQYVHQVRRENKRKRIEM